MTMRYVIRQISPPGKSALATEATAEALVISLIHGGPIMGDYLEWYDVDAKDGFGDDRWTADPEKALTFQTFEAATRAWKRQSRKRPIRDDGAPNRPLTAYSVSIEKLT